MTLRVGVVGAGQAGERHALGFAADPRAHLVGVADVRRSVAERLAASVGATAFGSVADLLARGIEVLVVALPNHLHLAPARAAAEQGVHVLMEKPIATTLDDAYAIVDACGSADVRLGVGFVHRYREEVRRAKAWIEDAGTPHVARESMASQRTQQHPAWLTKRATGGGVLLYGAIHGVDRLRWFLNAEVASTHARTHRYAGDSEAEDGIAALLSFENGATATLSANAPLYRAQPAPWETEVYGSRAMVRVRTRSWAETSSDDGQDRYEVASDPTVQTPHYNFVRQASSFVTAVLDAEAPPVTGTDGVRALEVCLALLRSARRGGPVDVAEVADTRRKGGRA